MFAGSFFGLALMGILFVWDVIPGDLAIKLLFTGLITMFVSGLLLDGINKAEKKIDNNKN